MHAHTNVRTRARSHARARVCDAPGLAAVHAVASRDRPAQLAQPAALQPAQLAQPAALQQRVGRCGFAFAGRARSRHWSPPQVGLPRVEAQARPVPTQSCVCLWRSAGCNGVSRRRSAGCCVPRYRWLPWAPARSGTVPHGAEGRARQGRERARGHLRMRVCSWVCARACTCVCVCVAVCLVRVCLVRVGLVCVCVCPCGRQRQAARRSPPARTFAHTRSHARPHVHAHVHAHIHAHTFWRTHIHARARVWRQRAAAA
jgi:hypothetical protein